MEVASTRPNARMITISPDIELTERCSAASRTEIVPPTVTIETAPCRPLTNTLPSGLRMSTEADNGTSTVRSACPS